jgi:hypothetical protein
VLRSASRIRIRRSSDRRADSFWRYQVLLDGKPVAALRPGRSKTLRVRPGKHSVTVRVDDRSRSPTLILDLVAGDRRALLCAPDHAGQADEWERRVRLMSQAPNASAEQRGDRWVWLAEDPCGG